MPSGDSPSSPPPKPPAVADLLADVRALLPHMTLREGRRIGGWLERLLAQAGNARRLRAGPLEGLLKEARQAHAAWNRRVAALPRAEFPEALPISARAEEIMAAIREHPVVVVAGETGSGKTTQLPKMCLAAGLGAAGRIACTQPRRVAALSVARRIAEELQVPFGKEVGAKIRFTDETGPETIIKMMTDGMLLAEIQADPELLDYEVVIVDEAHERSLNIDFLLGHLRMIREKRPDLKVIITSATIDTARFAEAFDNAPVISVSGRVFPVEVRYRPLEELMGDDADYSYIEGAVRVVDEILAENRPGDVLVFLPGERDIRDLREVLEGRRLGRTELLPLFGRLSNADQQRIFASTQARKIILATNIAETSITVPGIRYVIDAGLARVSRFSAGTRTQRLPIEPVAQSSAEQRKGRSGRVQDGVCFRLYSEKDFLARPKFTQPEIQRCNLAAVILRMMAFGLGEIEHFPFLDLPPDRAIRGGYQLLEELGALDEEHTLTPLGEQMARLPVDPTVARMVLEAQHEKALREVLVIASALSIQDPRERPLDQEQAAEQEHRRFRHAESDFLTLLNLWDASRGETRSASQRKLRKFCQAHFLNYLRMREWADIHDQLVATLADFGTRRPDKAPPADYDAIHRSLLAGLLGNVAQKDEGNAYKSTHSRKVSIFPGSGLFDREALKAIRKGVKGPAAAPAKRKGKTPAWIVCASFMETTRLYARTVARIDPAWVLDLGGHLLKTTYLEPAWDEKAQRVLVMRRLLLHGLEIERRKVAAVQVNPRITTEIFIRQALIEGGLLENPPVLEANRKLLEKLSEQLTRRRVGGVWQLEERLAQFYHQRLEAVGAWADVRRLAKQRHGGRLDFLQATQEVILPGGLPTAEGLPDSVEVDGVALPVKYTYKPGEQEDGATLRIPMSHFEALPPGLLDWVVPAYVGERVEALLRSLPKEIRIRLHPLSDTARELAAALKPSPLPLTDSLGALIRQRKGVHIAPVDWNLEAVPTHLRPRIELVDPEGEKVVAVGRDWDRMAKTYRAAIEERVQRGEGLSGTEMWGRARAQWETPPGRAWSFGDRPEQVAVGDIDGIPVVAFPGLKATHEGIAVHLYPTRAEAETGTAEGFCALAEGLLGRDWAWFQKELDKTMGRLGPSAVSLAPLEELRAQARSFARESLFLQEPVWPLREASFHQALKEARRLLPSWPLQYVDRVGKVLDLRIELLAELKGFPHLRAEVTQLVPPKLLARTTYDRLGQLPRYLECLRVRARRASLHPAKDATKEARVRPFREALARFVRQRGDDPAWREAVRRFRWMLEEFKVSVFAQELGTAEPVSEKRLKALVNELDQWDRRPTSRG